MPRSMRERSLLAPAVAGDVAVRGNDGTTISVRLDTTWDNDLITLVSEDG